MDRDRLLVIAGKNVCCATVTAIEQLTQGSEANSLSLGHLTRHNPRHFGKHGNASGAMLPGKTGDVIADPWSAKWVAGLA
jgi:hypothetical protein